MFFECSCGQPFSRIVSVPQNLIDEKIDGRFGVNIDFRLRLPHDNFIKWDTSSDKFEKPVPGPELVLACIESMIHTLIYHLSKRYESKYADPEFVLTVLLDRVTREIVTRGMKWYK